MSRSPDVLRDFFCRFFYRFFCHCLLHVRRRSATCESPDDVDRGTPKYSRVPGLGRRHAPGRAGSLGRHASAAVCGSMFPRRVWVHCGLVVPRSHSEHASGKSIRKHATSQEVWQVGRFGPVRPAGRACSETPYALMAVGAVRRGWVLKVGLGRDGVGLHPGRRSGGDGSGGEHRRGLRECLRQVRAVGSGQGGRRQSQTPGRDQSLLNVPVVPTILYCKG